MIVVIAGRVKVTVRSADGGELTLAVIQAGGMFGELGVADGGPRSTDAQTLEECHLLLISREKIQDICTRAILGAGPDEFTAATLRRLTEAAADMVFLDLSAPVAKVLLSRPRGEDGIIRLKMSQEELAPRAGGTQQSVDAALRVSRGEDGSRCMTGPSR